MENKMKNNLKVGDSFEVVEVLTYGGYYNVFKENGFTIGKKMSHGISCLSNSNKCDDNIRFRYMSILDNEVKPVGKLTITKLK
ncbi:MAG: kinase-like protein [Caudoviricetes sp.]|nr:MAG: kinase-like protein [Caudoviricetes sp.]